VNPVSSFLPPSTTVKAIRVREDTTTCLDHLKSSLSGLVVFGQIDVKVHQRHHRHPLLILQRLVATADDQ
jgi:hypothetical protein